jgi:glycosyltransferase involved in cell wall biosynthesis
MTLRDGFDITVVVPAYNVAPFLRKAVESVAAQTRGGWQLIIVDDGSTDDTLAVARGLRAEQPNLEVIPMGANRGVAAARNLGFRAASPSSRYVAFLDGDDAWEPNLLAALVARLEERSGIVAAYGSGRYVDPAGNVLRGDALHEHFVNRQRVVGTRFVDCSGDEETDFSCLVIRNRVLLQGCLIRRGFVDALGGFDETLRACEDWEFILRLSLLGAFSFVRERLFLYRRHDGNLTNDRPMLDRYRDLVRERIVNLPGLSEEQRRIAEFCDGRRPDVHMWLGVAAAAGHAKRG